MDSKSEDDIKCKKLVIFNFSNNYKFTTRPALDDETLEVVDQAKLLGVLTNDLKWDANTEMLVKKANTRIELLRKAASFSPSIEYLRTLYILYVRSIVEQSCVAWNSSLTLENINDLESVQKAAVRLMLGQQN